MCKITNISEQNNQNNIPIGGSVIYIVKKISDINYYYRVSHLLIQATAFFCIVFCFISCGTKKNTASSRNWQAFTTRYNVYFNGAEHYKETLGEMEKKYEDDYSRMLLIHPAEARADEKMPQPTGDFRRTIEKMQKAIQLHSITKKPQKRSSSAEDKAFRARDEFNPFLHNAWMMLGKAQYMDGDFTGAAITFIYISKHFTWLPETVTEARLWQALSYCALGWNYEAENALHPVKETDLVNNNLRNLYNLVQADYLIHTENYREATAYLLKASKSAHGSQKNRLWFLLGQIYTLTGDKNEAYEAFRQAGSGVSTDYRTKFNARIKQSEVYNGNDIKGEIKSLLSMAGYERNKEFLDQIYYAVGNLCLSRKDTAQAKKNYILAIEKSTRGGIDKALAQIALGNIYFSEGKYVDAQPYYAEAVPMLSDNFPDYKTISARSDVLDELALYYANVQLQDSLLKLAALTPEARDEVCRKLAQDYIRKEKEAEEKAKREEFLANSRQESSPMDKNLPTMPSVASNADNSWYFYNSAMRAAGKTEFQRKWGARKLEDDWRRHDKSSFSWDEDETGEGNPDAENNEEGDTSDNDNGTKDSENNPGNPAYYLKQIPSTPAELQTANEIVAEGLYNMGVILKDRLEDYPAARKEFTELLSRYPDNIYRLDVYYDMYLMAARENDMVNAEIWRKRIVDDFPESPYGSAMTNPDYFNNLRRMHEVQEEMYENAYNAYLDNRNGEVHRLTGEMERLYPLSPILPKFVFIDALSYLTEKEYGKFKDRLTELIQKWDETDMTDIASSILKNLKAGREPHSGLSNSRGMLWDTRLLENGTELSEEANEAKFETDTDVPYYLVLAFPLDVVNPNLVLYDVARFNFSSFVIKDFDLEPMRFSDMGLLVVKGFANLKELERYRSVMDRSNFELPEGVRPIMISKANFELLLREGRSFEDYFRFQEEETIENAERAAAEE